MSPEALEIVYEALARKLDAVGEEKSALFLAKLVLLLSQKNGDLAEVTACIDAA